MVAPNQIFRTSEGGEESCSAACPRRQPAAKQRPLPSFDCNAGGCQGGGGKGVSDATAEPHRRRCRLSWRGLTRVTGRGRPDAKQHSDILKMQADTACSAQGRLGQLAGVAAACNDSSMLSSNHGPPVCHYYCSVGSPVAQKYRRPMLSSFPSLSLLPPSWLAVVPQCKPIIRVYRLRHSAADLP